MSETLLTCHDLVKSYASGQERITVLDRCELALHTGEMLAIVGRSGVGKSTLLHLLAGLDLPDSGTVHLRETDMTSLSGDARADLRNRHIGMVFQLHHLLPEFTAEENVLMPFLIGRADPAVARRKTAQVLAELGLRQRAHHFPTQLSGGEQQRVALARAIAREPAVILADEPTGNLDPRTAEGVFELMLKVQRERGLTLAMVTHSKELARRCDRIAHLTEEGRFAPEPKRNELSGPESALM